MQNPQFNQVGAGTNFLGAAQAQGNYAQGLYGADVADTNAQNQTGAGIAATIAMLAMMA